MEYMATVPDKYFDLAIVDPPYGIDDKLYRSSYGKNSKGALALYSKNRWDITPNKEYFEELKRVSKYQIVWGGNYFTNLLSPNRCWICWNKDNPATNFSSVELAWTSFDALPNYYYYAWGGLSDGIKGRNKKEKSIHPTQKPIALYEWLLTNYAKKGQKVLDTHLGSGSSAIAAHYFGVDFVGCELDKDYFEAAKARFDMATKQLAMSI
jgi:site-specific DNA-methyltransferase (adenine-specific)